MRARRPQSALTIRPYQRRDMNSARDLVFFNFHAHTHLDWQTVDEFLREDPQMLWVAHREGRLVGIMGASDVMEGTCWLRIAGAEDSDQPKAVVREMWAWMCQELQTLGVHTVAALLLRDWMQSLLEEFGFRYMEDIVTLRRYGRHLPAAASAEPHIRHMEHDDIARVHAIDQAAFSPPWQMSLAEVRHGARISAYSSIAELDGQPIGYQIATTHGLNGHLARLAVLPSAQGRGVGGALVRDMLAWFNRRNVLAITVNTQDGNIRSQRLYERYHFQRNGYDLPMWITEIG